jgi:hypothetical protein
VGASAGARRGAEGGYEGGARHIYRVIGLDVVFIVCPLGPLGVGTRWGALVFLGLRERPGLEGAGCGEPHIKKFGLWGDRMQEGREKKLGVKGGGGAEGRPSWRKTPRICSASAGKLEVHRALEGGGEQG